MHTLVALTSTRKRQAAHRRLLTGAAVKVVTAALAQVPSRGRKRPPGSGAPGRDGRQEQAQRAWEFGWTGVWGAGPAEGGTCWAPQWWVAGGCAVGFRAATPLTKKRMGRSLLEPN